MRLGGGARATASSHTRKVKGPVDKSPLSDQRFYQVRVRPASVDVNDSSSRSGGKKLTAKGRSVRSRIWRMPSRNASTGRPHAPRLPSATASDTATTSAGDVCTLVPAWMIGT